jgi:hypothetical protein
MILQGCLLRSTYRHDSDIYVTLPPTFCTLSNHPVQTASYPMSDKGLFPWGYSSRGVKLTTHLHLVSRSRMCGAIPAVPNIPSWQGIQLNPRDNFFTFTFCIKQYTRSIAFLNQSVFKVFINKEL